MTRWLPLLLLLPSLGCRVQRSWTTQVTVAPGTSLQDVWIATQADDIEPTYKAHDCAAPLISGVSEGLRLTLKEWDGWQGECWALVDVSLDADAAERTSADIEFNFNLCAGLDKDSPCPDDLQDQTQVRVLTVVAP